MIDLPKTYNYSITKDLVYPMVLVEPGIFIMGDKFSALARENTEHRVRLTKPFYIGVNLVTQAIWKKIMNVNNPSYFLGEKRPVERISWFDIVGKQEEVKKEESFLKKLNEHDKSDFTDYTFRLPTEAEWEYTAKGGHINSIPDGLHPGQKITARDLYSNFAGSDALKEVGWYIKNSHQESKEVGLLKPNELGLFDMSGNVGEWCMDKYDIGYYSRCTTHGLVENPVNTRFGKSHVVRGGSWHHDALMGRVSARQGTSPDFGSNFLGFRLVLASTSSLNPFEGSKFFLKGKR